MRQAFEVLVRCHVTSSTREMLKDICALTGERQWEVFYRLVIAEFVRLFHPGDDGLAEKQEP